VSALLESSLSRLASEAHGAGGPDHDPQAPLHRTVSNGRSASVWLVDEEEREGHELARRLEDHGIATRVMPDGRAALSAMADAAPVCAIIGLQLPDMHGLKLLSPLREARADARVVMLSAYASVAVAVQAVRLGARDVLCRPCSVGEILQALGLAPVDRPALPVSPPISVERLEWEHIQRVLLRCQFNLSAAAREMRMHRRTLQRKLDKRPPAR
jgi:two-component system, response regulator RegA